MLIKKNVLCDKNVIWLTFVNKKSDESCSKLAKRVKMHKNDSAYLDIIIKMYDDVDIVVN